MADYGVTNTAPTNPQEGDTFTSTEGYAWIWTSGQWVPQAGQAPQIRQPGTPLSPWAKKQVATKAAEKKAAAAGPTHEEKVAALAKKLGENPDTALPPDVASLIAEEAVGREESSAGAAALAKILNVSPDEANAILEKALAGPVAPETAPTDETALDLGATGVGDGGGGAAPMTAEEKEVQAAGVLVNLMAEKGARQRASVEELGNILDKWIDVLKGSVTPEQLKISEERARTGPGSFKGVEINLEPERQRALALGQDLGADMPELQRVLKQILPGFQGGGWSWNVPVTPEGVYGLLGETNPYGPVTNMSDWEKYKEYWAQGESAPSTQQAFMQMWGGGNPAEIGLPFGEGPGHFGYTQPGQPGYRQTEGGRQADLAAQTDKEIELIRGQEAEDLAAINNAADEKLAQIDADTRIKVAQLQATGQQAQAQATIEAARQQAQAVIESAQIDAAARKEVTAMQEQGAKERLGAQLGMQWAETSQQMAANPRDYLALAFRQSGQGIPSSLQNYLQPAGGAVPTTKGAPAGIQSILSQYLG